jgi:hypothetical protein
LHRKKHPADTATPCGYGKIHTFHRLPVSFTGAVPI